MANTKTSNQAVTGIRKLQRKADKLRKRYLSPKRQSGDVAMREAVNYANGCCWRTPCYPDNPASVDKWASNWMSAYQRRFDEVLAAAAAGRFEVCDKCDGQNDRNDANYCTRCSAEFQAQTLLNPECQPVGSK